MVDSLFDFKSWFGQGPQWGRAPARAMRSLAPRRTHVRNGTFRRWRAVAFVPQPAARAFSAFLAPAGVRRTRANVVLFGWPPARACTKRIAGADFLPC